MVRRREGHVFISYKREEADTARALREALEADGFTTWWDEEVQCGEQWAQVIDDAVNTANAIVVLWSERALTSRWVTHEASAAMRGNVYAPARIELVQIPSPYDRIQATDLLGWHRDVEHAGYVSLRQRLDELMPLPASWPARVGEWSFRNASAIALVVVLAAAFLVLSDIRGEVGSAVGAVADVRGQVESTVQAVHDVSEQVATNGAQLEATIGSVAEVKEQLTVTVEAVTNVQTELGVTSSAVTAVQNQLGRTTEAVATVRDDLEAATRAVEGVGDAVSMVRGDTRAAEVRQLSAMLLREPCKERFEPADKAVYGLIALGEKRFPFGACMVRALLTKQNLEATWLRAANLEGANLTLANLRGAELSSANLRWAMLDSTMLEEASLRGADLRDALLVRAQLAGADLCGAELRDATLWRADLHGAKRCPKDAPIPGWKLVECTPKNQSRRCLTKAD